MTPHPAETAERADLAACLMVELAQAEGERAAAELAGDLAREAAVVLAEQVAFLEEQLRSTRDFLAREADTECAGLRDERAALLQEVAVLHEELQNHARMPRHA